MDNSRLQQVARSLSGGPEVGISPLRLTQLANPSPPSAFGSDDCRVGHGGLLPHEPRPEDLRSQREALNLSQLRLARLTGFSRFRIVAFESGCGELSADELAEVQEALEAVRCVRAALERGKQKTRTASGGMAA